VVLLNGTEAFLAAEPATLMAVTDASIKTFVSLLNFIDVKKPVISARGCGFVCGQHGHIAKLPTPAQPPWTCTVVGHVLYALDLRSSTYRNQRREFCRCFWCISLRFVPTTAIRAVLHFIALYEFLRLTDSKFDGRQQGKE
jgi:hypothetical protein